MKCPYCDKDMKKGFIDAKGTPIWTQSVKMTRIAFKNEVKLNDYMGIWCSAAYLCSDCGKIIVDLEDKINVTNINTKFD